MDFSDYSIEEVNDLSCEIAEYIKKYTEEKLQGFTEKQKIIIGSSALWQLLMLVNVANINLGITTFEDFKKHEDLMIDFVKRNTKTVKK